MQHQIFEIFGKEINVGLEEKPIFIGDYLKKLKEQGFKIIDRQAPTPWQKNELNPRQFFEFTKITYSDSEGNTHSNIVFTNIVESGREVYAEYFENPIENFNNILRNGRDLAKYQRTNSDIKDLAVCLIEKLIRAGMHADQAYYLGEQAAHGCGGDLTQNEE